MATKLTANVAKRVKSLGIKGTTDEEVRPKLLEILEENGIEQMDDEDITTLVEIAESFVDAEEVGDDEEAENDALAEEVEEEEEAKKPAKKAAAKKPTKKAPEPEPEEEEEEEEEESEEEETEEEGDELDQMDRGELKALIKSEGFEIAVKKSWSDDDIRNEIRKAEEKRSSEKKKPAAKKESPAPAPKKEAPAKKSAAAPAKKETKAEKPAPKKRSHKLDPKNREEDRRAFDFLKKLFPEDRYIYAWIAAGLTIKFKGKNSNRSIISIENCSVKGEGKDAVMSCHLYLSLFNGKYEILDNAEIEYDRCWSQVPFIKSIEISEVMEILVTLLPEIEKLLNGIDKKLGDNRKKMEDNLKKEKTVAKKTVKKAAEPEEEEEEDEEEAPKTKKAAPAPKKKAVKKEEAEEEEEEDDEEEKPAPKKKVAVKKTVNKKK